MINESKTFELFGYYSTDVKRTDKVVAHCSICDTDRIISKCAAIKSTMCLKCQRITHAKKIAKINRFGRKHSEETKIKIGISNTIAQPKGKTHPNYGKKRSDETKEKMKISNIRIISDKQRKIISDCHKGKKLSDEHRKKLSIKNKSRSGIKNPMYGQKAKHGKGEYYIKSDGTKIWMRSSWEFKIAKYLDLNNYNWKYEPISFPIKYNNNGIIKDGTFRPDFYIMELDEYWEIKGWWRDDAKEKYNSFCEQYKNLNIKLYMKEELKKLGLI